MTTGGSSGPPLTIQNGSLAEGYTGKNYSVPLLASGGVPPYTWSAPTGIASGLELTSAPSHNEIVGNPTEVGAFNVTLEVRDSKSHAATRNFTLVVREGLWITVPSTLYPIVNGEYQYALKAVGGDPPFTWTCSGLPPGLICDPSGAITGIPSSLGWFGSTIEVQDSKGQRDLTIVTFRVQEPLRVTTENLPAGNIGIPYSFSLAAIGGSGVRSWSVATGASLPAGIALTPLGALQGTPTEWGTFPFTLEVHDEGPPVQTTSAALTLQIENNLFIQTNSGLPPGVVTKPYSQSLTALGGTLPYHWSIVSVNPAGALTIDPAAGKLNGTPAVEGQVVLTVEVLDASVPTKSARKDFWLYVNPLPFIWETDLPDGAEGVEYIAYLNVGGGIPPYSLRVSEGQLPAGMTIMPTINYVTPVPLSGTPATVGSYAFTVELTDSSLPVSPATRNFTLRINERLKITTTSLPEGNIGDLYSAQFSATGGIPPYHWGWEGPFIAGLNLDQWTAKFSGVPQVSFSGSVVFAVSDSANNVQWVGKEFLLNIKNVLRLRTSRLPLGRPSVPYDVILRATGGTLPLQWSIPTGSLPEGLSLDNATGQITGTPVRDQTASFTIRVTDSSNPRVQDERALLLAIASNPGRNDTPATATPISNGTFRASISPYADPVAGPANPDHDYYQLTAAPGAIVTIETVARRLVPESFLDSVIEVVDADGNRFGSCRPGNQYNGYYDQPCLNDDIDLGIVQDSRLQFQVPGSDTGPVTFYVRVFSFDGSARPDYVYDLTVSGAN